MASASCATSIGFRSSAEPGTTNSVSCATLVGFAAAAAPVPWAGNQPSREKTDWLPRIDEPVMEVRDARGNVIGRGYLLPRLWNYLRVIGDERLGGPKGVSIAQVVSNVQVTQQAVAATATYVDQSIAYTQSVAASAEATAQVAQNNGLSGSGSIPPPSPPPNRPNYQVE